MAASFLSAVADRFGIWGAYGQPHVAWGNFARFVNYTHVLTPAFPMSASVFFAWAATTAETVLAILLLAGWRIRAISTLSALLLLAFAVSMALSLGIKAPLDYSVFTAAAASLVLSCRVPDRFTLDARSRSSHHR
ncbi:MAG TPA: hypothetical protein VN633_03880 [Bryobacteraceae bacterium]|nr:hypothetical protein [Bryobacteraceae bacterium]